MRNSRKPVRPVTLAVGTPVDEDDNAEYNPYEDPDSPFGNDTPEMEVLAGIIAGVKKMDRYDLDEDDRDAIIAVLTGKGGRR